jgi:uncharacterized protein (TIGR00369 family)
MDAPADPQFAERIRASFVRQKAMTLIGASLATVAPGVVEITLPFRDDLTQQKGFVHGGIIGMIADSACGYAAYSLMPADCTLVTAEYKINLLASATSSLVARAEVYADDRTHIATMQQTLMMLPGRTDHPE